MSCKVIELLLIENVESVGIVGDVVKVKSGYARNFLLPRGFATTPSAEKIAELAERRVVAERERDEVRTRREQDVDKLQGYEVSLERACNDQGQLYGSVTQQDISDALNAAGFEIRPRDVRLPQTIKRIDSYDVSVKPEQDLEAVIKLWVVSDRELPGDNDRDEVQVDEEGEMIEPIPVTSGAPTAEAAAEKTEETEKTDADA